MTSVLQQWIMALPLRHQGVVLAITRGCDGYPKEDPSKAVTRALRSSFMIPADERELKFKGGYMYADISQQEIDRFLSDWDKYPVHFWMHLLHAAEIIGYKHPSPLLRGIWSNYYFMAVDRMHLRPETETDMDVRLTRERLKEVQEYHETLLS